MSTALDTTHTRIDPPELHGDKDRMRWVAEMIVTGRWERGMREACAEKWHTTPGTVGNIAHWASVHADLVVNDKERLQAMSLLRMNNEADEAAESRDRIAALDKLLKATGAYSQHRIPGNDHDHELGGEDKLRRAAELIARPKPNMCKVLEEAFRNPSRKLIKILEQAGFARVVDTEGEQA